MDELETTTSVETADDDWDSIDLSDVIADSGASDEEDFGTDTAAEETEEPAPEEKADQPDEGAEKKPDDTAVTPEQQLQADQPFTLKHMDETRTVNREEVISLAQKGMDYDRIRGKLDETNATLQKQTERMSWLDDMAKQQGMSIDDLIDQTRAQVMAKKTGKDPDICLGLVKNERRAAEIEAERKKLQEQSTATSETAAKKAKQDADVQAFTKAFPDVARAIADKKAEMPKEVWDAVNSGDSLVSAYRAYELKQAKAEVERLKAEAAQKEQKEKNKAATTGSMSTKGGGKSKDKWLDGWYD